MGRVSLLQDRLADQRSRRVVFVSHCLLNQNVRYLGGACCPGVVGEFLDSWQAQGVGVCQMPCPEQRAWGGVLKRATIPAYGAANRWYWPLRAPVLRLFQVYTRLRYRRLASRVASEIRDYRRSGNTVVGIVGVSGSPSCGVRTTLDVHGWLEVVGRCRPDLLEPCLVNAEAIGANEVAGQGWFIRELARRTRDSTEVVPLLEYRLPTGAGAAERLGGARRSGPGGQGSRRSAAQ